MTSRFLQILFIIIGFLLVAISVFYYLEKNPRKSSIEEKEKTELTENIDKQMENIFENITYTGVDSRDNPFEIKSKFAETSIENPDITFMKFVTAKLYTKNGEVILITSDAATFNKRSNDMFFSIDVVANYNVNKIYCENLDFHNNENLIVAYNDLTAYNGNNIMIADEIKVDLNKKTSIVSMYNKDKVQVKLSDQP